MALTHDAFVVQKIVLQHDTLEMAQQHLKSQHANQARYYDLHAYGFPYQSGAEFGYTNPNTQEGCVFLMGHPVDRSLHCATKSPQ